MISANHITAGYVAGQEILKDVTFTLKEGTFYFISGESGAGKTTLLSILGLTLRPSGGTLNMFGKNIAALPRQELSALRRKIGLVSQDYRLLPHLSVAENVGLPLKIAGESPQVVRGKVEEMLNWVGLKEHSHTRPDMLSGGQKQRTAIARAVITKPALLLADEPTGNLDQRLSLRFMRLFEAMHEMGTTVLFATHDEALITQFGHPVLKLQDGVIKA